MSDLPAISTDDKTLALRREAESHVALVYREFAQGLFDRCQSPIEELLLAALLCEFASGEVEWHYSDGSEDKPFIGVFADVFVQASVGKYRADFLFVKQRPDGNGERIVVECDGHDYHERTKAQARHDRSRDRWMVQEDIRVLRFTGSEIYGDPAACAAQIYKVVMA